MMTASQPISINTPPAAATPADEGRPQSGELDGRIEALLKLIVVQMRRHHRHRITELASVIGSPIGGPPEVRRRIEERLTLFGAKPGALRRKPATDDVQGWDKERIRKRIEELITTIAAETGQGRTQSAEGSTP